MTTRQKVAPPVIAMVIAALGTVGLLRVGFAPVLIIGGSALIAYVVWLLTTWRAPADPGRTVPLYLLLVAAELVHMAEEYLADFPGELSALFDLPGLDRNLFVVAFVLAGGALAMLAAYGVYHRDPFANYFVWFVVVGPGLVNAVAHISFPFIAGRLYFPGLITVALPTVAAILLIPRLLEARRGPRPSLRPHR